MQPQLSDVDMTSNQCAFQSNITTFAHCLIQPSIRIGYKQSAHRRGGGAAWGEEGLYLAAQLA